MRARLSSGRVVWMDVDPAVASVGDAEHLRHTIIAKQARRERAVGSQASAIRAATTKLADQTRHLSRLQFKGRTKSIKAAVSAYGRQDEKASTTFAVHRSGAQRMAKQHETWIGWAGKRHRLEQLVIASSLPLLAAYGRSGTPLDANNMTLGVLAGVWLLGDKVTSFMGATKVPEPGLQPPDVWSYVTPAANVLLGWLLLHQRQNERLISGFARALSPVVVRVEGTRRVTIFEQQIDLLPFVAPLHRDDFIGFASAPAVAAVSDLQWTPTARANAAQIAGVAAQARQGVLTVTVQVAESLRIDDVDPLPVATLLTVAWVVDTRELA